MNKLTEHIKVTQAKDILNKCLGEKGVWADPTRYRYQCWTRDFVLATMPTLFELGETKQIYPHLMNLSERQKSNGQIPILFLDNTAGFIWDKVKKSVKDYKLSFMLKRYISGNLWNLTPGTKDSEILYVIGMHEYARQTGNHALVIKYSANIQRAIEFIEANLFEDGLVIGCDWRDTMEKELGNKPLLTNNCLMYHAYMLNGDKEKAEILRNRINKYFWRGNSYMDNISNDRFDPLGGSFAILFDVAPKERYTSLISSFKTVDTASGVTIKCRHNPLSYREKEVIERTYGVVVWPFVVGFAVLALMKIGEAERAKEQFEKLLNLDGFREWYDPDTGMGYGAYEQLWSAALFLRADKALSK